MAGQIIIREFRKEDAATLENVIRETWKYDQLCSPETARRLARVYLWSCLTNQTKALAAVNEGVPVGIIMGKNSSVYRCPLSYRLRQIAAILALYVTKEGRKVSEIFQDVDGIDKDLLKGIRKNYPGEIAFFAVNSRFRGYGIGKMLFQKMVSYMKEEGIDEFYLFTDTSCNYPFYEHQGMVRRGEKKHRFRLDEGETEMTFYIYDYKCA